MVINSNVNVRDCDINYTGFVTFLSGKSKENDIYRFQRDTQCSCTDEVFITT